MRHHLPNHLLGIVSAAQLVLFNPLPQRAQLKTARAWALREQFRWFWEGRSERAGEKFFRKWHAWASRRRLKPIQNVAKMLQRRLDNILTWFEDPISNALAEGFNSVIQTLKANAWGFRSLTHH